VAHKYGAEADQSFKFVFFSFFYFTKRVRATRRMPKRADSDHTQYINYIPDMYIQQVQYICSYYKNRVNHCIILDIVGVVNMCK